MKAAQLLNTMRFKLDRDRNGNSIVRVHPETGRAFSVQTNGNLPRTHRDGVGSYTHIEVWDHIMRHGTERQFELLGGKGNL